MNRGAYLIVGLVIALVSGLSLFFIVSLNTKKNDNLNLTRTVQIKNDPNLDQSKITNSEETVESEDGKNTSLTSSNKSEQISSFLSGYTDYDTSKLANAKYGRVILFFHASWCPSCRGLETNIKQNINSIPEDMLILKVDYDSNQELRNKYQITSQHTLVQVNATGDKIKSNVGLYQLNTLDSVINVFK